MISGEQFRAARAILRLEQSALAEASGVSVESIKRLEGYVGEVTGRHETARIVQETLERLGVIFIDDDESAPRGGPGVRLAETGATERWNAQLRMIIEEFIQNLEIELDERQLASERLLGAIEGAKDNTYGILERTVRDENTDDMFATLDREALRKISSPGTLSDSSNAVKRLREAMREKPDEGKKTPRLRYAMGTRKPPGDESE